jgi:hypothetical protein
MTATRQREPVPVRKEQVKMMQQSRRRMLIKAVHDATLELARIEGARYATAPLENMPGGAGSVRLEISTKVPDGWTFEHYPPPKPKPKMLAISALAIFERVRLTIPNVTLEEVQDAIMQSLPYMGGRRQ